MDRTYLLMNDQDKAVAKATLASSLDGEVVQFRLQVERGARVEVGQTLRFIGNDESTPDFVGVVERRREDQIVVRSTAPLDKGARKNLRVDVQFRSLLYPISGSWKGRRVIRGEDLSCGGVAFYCSEPLQVGEIAQIVLPMTENPLLLQVQILRIHTGNSPLPLYAARFVDMIHDEEALVRRAVFDIQMAAAR